MSKAFEKSKIARSVCSFLSHVFIISFVVVISCVSDECPLQKPCCRSVSMLCCSRWFKI